MKAEKVLIGVSGGVDSAVAALLLKKRGYDVIGANLELFSNLQESDEIRQNEDKDGFENAFEEGASSINQDAKRVCDAIGIPFYSYSLKEKFQKYVVDDFIHCYANGKTPNPCVECNRYLKFGAMFELAQKLGCNYLATGHYAKVEYSEQYARWILKKSNAGKKDQSYVLWNIRKEVLPHLLFPLGDFENKEQIRKYALENHLPVASKPDSEDICFIPDGDYKKFLEENSFLKPKEGNIVTTKGEVLGTHQGLYRYTIGQRKGLKISHSVPLFVVGFSKEKNELIVGEESELYRKEMYVENSNLLLVDDLSSPRKVTVKTRYTSKEVPATIEMVTGDKIKVTFEEPVARITPGQSAVFYEGDFVLGGGKIV